MSKTYEKLANLRTGKRGDIRAAGKLRSSRDPYHFTVLLWNDVEKLRLKVGLSELAMAAVIPVSKAPTAEIPVPHAHECLGSIHFAIGSWDIEVVAHEVQHAILHRGRLLMPTLGHLMSDAVEEEEELAYEAGIWVASLWKWLKEQDPDCPGLSASILENPDDLYCL